MRKVNMIEQEKQIKEGIKLHLIQNNRFKTNLIAVFLTVPLEKETVTKNAIIPAILRRGSESMPTQEEISMQLEEMYGAVFNCGIEKKGDNQILKFYFETVSDEFLPEHENNLLQDAITKLFDIIFNPKLEDNRFKSEYLEQEKKNLKQVIEGRADNKGRYALERCIEEMYKGSNFAFYKFGYLEDLEKIQNADLYDYYKEMIQNCRIDIYISGILKNDIIDYIEKDKNFLTLKERNPKYFMNEEAGKAGKNNENVVFENLDVTQGKLILGLKVLTNTEEEQYHALLYNSILGGSANSKLFQNVRERASLAYTASSSYMRMKNTIYINCGIEIENYEKALNIIKQQIEEMKKENFTNEEVENAKRGYISAIKAIEDEQDTEVMYYFGQEFTRLKLSIEEYVQKIEAITKEDILKVANSVVIDTIYFLQDGSVKQK